MICFDLFLSVFRYVLQVFSLLLFWHLYKHLATFYFIQIMPTHKIYSFTFPFIILMLEMTIHISIHKHSFILLVIIMLLYFKLYTWIKSDLHTTVTILNNSVFVYVNNFIKNLYNLVCFHIASFLLQIEGYLFVFLIYLFIYLYVYLGTH